MKYNRETLPLIFIAYAILVFVLTWIFGVGYITIGILFLIGIFAFSLTGFLKLNVSRNSMTLALLGYLGISFISLSKFKADIANWEVDVNMISAGIALIGIALALNSQYKEREVKTNPLESLPQPHDSDTHVTLEGLESIDVVLDEVRRKIDFQFQQLDGLAIKAGIVLGVAGVIFTLIVTNLLSQPSITLNLYLAKIALLPIILALVLAFIAIYVLTWDRPPKLERLRDYYIVKDVKVTKLNVIDKCLEAIEKNKKLMDRLFSLVKCSYFLLLIGFVLLAVWIGMNIW